MTRPLWDGIDQKAFAFFNGWIQTNPYWQAFWSMGNHSYTDWFFDGIIAIFLGTYIFQAPRHLKLRRFCQALFAIIITVTTILIINSYLFRHIVVIDRDSPSLLTPMATFVSQITSWMHIKTTARQSFPADHATLGVMFIVIMNILMGRKRGFLALLVGILFILPRLVVGAHWLTDVVIGSLSISLFAISWTFYTPIYHTVVSKLEAMFRWCFGMKSGTART